MPPDVCSCSKVQKVHQFNVALMVMGLLFPAFRRARLLCVLHMQGAAFVPESGEISIHCRRLTTMGKGTLSLTNNDESAN